MIEGTPLSAAQQMELRAHLKKHQFDDFLCQPSKIHPVKDLYPLFQLLINDI
jgi:hypothetical protein